MITFNYLMAQALIVLNAKLKKENTAKRIGSLFRDILYFIQNMLLGIILKGDKSNEAEIKSIIDPKRGDTYKAADTRHYWCYDGTSWNDIGEIIPSDVATKSDLLELEGAKYIKLVSDDEYLLKVVSQNDYILWGIKTDLSTFDYKISSSTRKELLKYFKKENIELDITNSKNPLAAQAIYNVIRYVDNEEYPFQILDSLDRALVSINNTGKVELPLQELLTKTKHAEYLFTIEDVMSRIIIAIKKDGTFSPTLLELPKSTWIQIDERIKSILQREELNISNIYVGNPTGLCRIDFYGGTSGMTQNVSKLLEFKFTDNNGKVAKCFAETSWQGSGSLKMPKKNYAIDLLDENGDSLKWRFGNWLAFDSFHLKANYIDAMHARNIVTARLYENMLLTYPIGQQRAWQYYNSATEILSPNLRYETGALQHIDGFPTEIYINGEYQGLFTLNIKKHRSNFQMEKSNNNHILLGMGVGAMVQYPVDWTKWEIRNPKGFDENVEPPAGVVKTKIETFFQFVSNLNSSTTKAEFASRTIVPMCIDFRLIYWIADLFDLNGNNTLYGTWDGIHWTPLPYDLDSTFGMHYDGSNADRAPNINTDNSAFVQRLMLYLDTIYKTELEQRYKQLRTNGVFTVDGIMQLFKDFTLQIGTEAYNRDYKKWTEIPSNRPNGTYPNYPQNGGWYMDFEQLVTWITGRLSYLDTKYNYND